MYNIAIDIEMEYGIITRFYDGCEFVSATKFKGWTTKKKCKAFIDTNWPTLARLVPYGAKVSGFFYLHKQNGGD